MTLFWDSLVRGAFLVDEMPASFGGGAGWSRTHSSSCWRPLELVFMVLIMTPLGDSLVRGAFLVEEVPTSSGRGAGWSSTNS